MILWMSIVIFLEGESSSVDWYPTSERLLHSPGAGAGIADAILRQSPSEFAEQTPRTRLSVVEVQRHRRRPQSQSSVPLM